MSDNDVFLQKSVTYNDQGEVTKSGIMRVVIPFAAYGYDQIALSPKPPAFWSPQRDIMLRSTVYHEPMWAGAIGVALTKMASKAWEITSKIPKRQKDAQQLLLHADGHQVGWTAFLCKNLRDYLTTDNGAFIEIVREGRGKESRVTGIRHLDSLRCIRTGDPDTPVMYRDRKGQLHYMKSHQVMMLSDMPDPGETYFGVGMSAASRAYLSIYGLAAIQWYMSEKVSGLHPLAIHIVNGVLDTQLQGAVEAAKSQELSRGVTSYMGAVVVGVPSQAPPELVTIPLAELPDRFSRKEEFDLAVLAYANALGLDVQDLQPLSGQNLGTGTQSNTLADKAMGKGLVAWQQQFEHLVNENLLDDETEFSFVERDYRDQSQKAAVSKARTEVSAARIAAQITTPQQELVILVEDDELPKEFLPQGAAAGSSPLSDEEKPFDQYNQATPASPVPGQAPQAQPPIPGQPGQPGQPAQQQGLPPVPAGFGGGSPGQPGQPTQRPPAFSLGAGSSLAQAMTNRVKIKSYTPPAGWSPPPKILPSPEQRRRAAGLVSGISPLALELLTGGQDETESRSRPVSAKSTDRARLYDDGDLVEEKHLKGGHNQKRHGWRFGDLKKARRGMRAGISEDFAGQTTPEDERLAYRKRAGMPAPPARISKRPDYAPATPKGKTGAQARAEISKALDDRTRDLAELRAAEAQAKIINSEYDEKIVHLKVQQKFAIEDYTAGLIKQAQAERRAAEDELYKKYPANDRIPWAEVPKSDAYKRAMKNKHALQKELKQVQADYYNKRDQIKQDAKRATPELAAMTDEIDRLTAEKNDRLKNHPLGDLSNLSEKERAVNQNFKAATVKALRSDKPTKINAVAVRFGDSRDGAVKDGAEIFNQIVSADLLPAGTEVSAVKGGRGRASFGYQVNMTTGSGSGTFLHELGHWLEDKVPKFGAAARLFLDKRTAGETEEKLSKLTGDKAYKSHELARKDKFVDPYMGKLYPFSTEITSMFFTMLFGHDNSIGYGTVARFVRFMRDDPEYFDFVYEALQGRFPDWMNDLEVNAYNFKTSKMEKKRFGDLSLSDSVATPWRS